MGSGRKSKPVELKIAEGNPGRRPLPAVPQYDRLTGKPPGWLPREAKAEWRRIVTALSPAGVIKVTDRSALIAICAEWASYVTATKDVLERGTIVPGMSRGESCDMKNPNTQIARESLEKLLRLWAAFGLTPSDRARFDIGGKGEEEKTKILGLLTGGGTGG